MATIEKNTFNIQLNKAASAYALEVLGEAQFKKNKDAKLSIISDFKDGAKWAKKHLKA